VRLSRQRLTSVVLGVGLGLLLGFAIHAWRSSGPALGGFPMYEARGQIVDLGGRGAYIDCRGSGQPTVVLENGMGSGAGGWGVVLDEVASFTRVCAWDRPGLGRSGGRGEHTVGDAVEDLRATLDGAGAAPPYVVVSHSLGGVYARVFTDRHTTAVAGLVFVDAFWPDIHTTTVKLSEEFLEHSRADTAATAALVAETEALDWPASLAELAATGPLTVPAEILAVDQRGRYDDRWWTPDMKAAAIAEWESKLRAKFPEGRITIVEGSGHVIQYDRPDAVIAAVRRVVDAARAAVGHAPR
jgi:pimeloyl-ACP methyl ester carboxylesterase